MSPLEPAVRAPDRAHALRRPLIPSASAPTDWIAVVDDDPSIRVALTRALRGIGVPVETFASADEYLARRGGMPRCLVLDVHLVPGPSGFELHDRLVADGIAPPVIFITGGAEIPAARIRAGVCGHLRKPFVLEALLALVKPHLVPSA